MFPLADTELVEVKDGYVIQSPLGRLHVSSAGQFKSLAVKSLSQPDNDWLLESIGQMPEHVRALEVTDRDQLAFSIPEKESDDPNSQKNAFYVLRNQQNLIALGTFFVVYDALNYRPSDGVYSLAEIFSISNAGDSAALHSASQRWLAGKARGPFSTMAIAYCYANARDAQRAADYAAEAMQLFTRESSIRHDLDRIFVASSTLGRAANQIDARHLHKFISQIASTFDSDENVSNLLRLTEPPAVERAEQWKFVIAKLVPIVLQPPMQSIASQLNAGITRTATR